MLDSPESTELVKNCLLQEVPFWAERTLDTWTITGKRGADPTADAAFDEIVHDHIATRRRQAAQQMRWGFNAKTKRTPANALGAATKGNNEVVPRL